MGGFLGIGSSSAKTDRNQTLGDYGKLNSVFNQGLALGGQQQQAGQENLGASADYFKKLLTAGRTDTAARSAPAINSTLAQSDAARRNQAASGTNRTGGNAANNQAAGTETRSSIDNIINQNLVGGQEEGAKGLEQIGGTQLSDAMNLLGLGTSAAESTLSNSINSRELSDKIAQEQGAAYGNLLGLAFSGGN